MKRRVSVGRDNRMTFRADDKDLQELIGKVPARFRKQEKPRARGCVTWAVLDSDWAWAFMKWATMLGYEVKLDG